MYSIIAVTNKHTAKLHHVGSLYVFTIFFGGGHFDYSPLTPKRAAPLGELAVPSEERRTAVLLRSEYCYLLTDVSGQYVGSQYLSIIIGINHSHVTRAKKG